MVVIPKVTVLSIPISLLGNTGTRQPIIALFQETRSRYKEGIKVTHPMEEVISCLAQWHFGMLEDA